MRFTNDQLFAMDPLEVLEQLDGYYTCPKDGQGNRLGPLVGYAGCYEGPDGAKFQFVGDEYANFALAEEWLYILDIWADLMFPNIPYSIATCGLGMPMGGLHWNTSLCRRMAWRAVFPDKEVISAKTANDRERSRLVMGRHAIHPTESVVIVEDVCNNFSTTAQAIELVAANLGYVAGIACLLNRSGRTEFQGYPIFALVDRVIPEYKQDDPYVASDVAIGNLVRKPKDEWARLAAAREAAKQR